MYQLTCPACGHVRVGPFVRVEAVVRCVKCGKVFTVTPDLVLRTVAAPPVVGGPAVGAPAGSAPAAPVEASAAPVPAAPSPEAAALVGPPSQTTTSQTALGQTGSSILELIRSAIPAHMAGSAGPRWRAAMRSRAALIGSVAAGAVVLLGLLIWALSGGDGPAETRPADDEATEGQGPVARVLMAAEVLRVGDWQEVGDLLPASASSTLAVVEAMNWPGGRAGEETGNPPAEPGAEAGDEIPTTPPGAEVVVKVRNVTDQVVVGSVLELVMWTPGPTRLAKLVSRMDLPVLLSRESLQVRAAMPEGLTVAGSTLTGRLLGGEAWPEGVVLEVGGVRVSGGAAGGVDHVVVEIEPAEARSVQEVTFEVAARDKDDRVVGRWGVTGRLTRDAGEAAVVELKLPASFVKADGVRWQAVGVGRPAPRQIQKP